MHHIEVNERPSIIYCFLGFLHVTTYWQTSHLFHFSLLMLYEQHEHQP